MPDSQQRALRLRSHVVTAACVLLMVSCDGFGTVSKPAEDPYADAIEVAEDYTAAVADGKAAAACGFIAPDKLREMKGRAGCLAFHSIPGLMTWTKLAADGTPKVTEAVPAPAEIGIRWTGKDDTTVTINLVTVDGAWKVHTVDEKVASAE